MDGGGAYSLNEPRCALMRGDVMPWDAMHTVPIQRHRGRRYKAPGAELLLQWPK